MHKPKSVLDKEKHKSLWNFKLQTYHPEFARKRDPVIISKILLGFFFQRTYRIVDFAIPVNHRVKIKENEKRNKYFDLPRQLRKQWNMKISVVFGTLGTVHRCLEKEQ